MKRKCVLCGKEFETNTRTLICPKDHYFTCPDCGKIVLWRNTVPFIRCKQCAYKHAALKRKETMTKRYGAPTTLQSKELTQKVKDTVMEKYGVDNVMKNKDIKTKAEQTCIKKYGVRNPMSDPDIAKKSAESRKANMDEIVEHMKQTWLQKYGVNNPSKCPEVIDKITDTFMKKYGVKRAVNVSEFRQKMVDTMMERYGVPYYVFTEDYRKYSSSINKKFGELLEKNNISFTTEFGLENRFYDFKLTDNNILIEVDPSYTHNIVGNHFSNSGLDFDYHLLKSQIAEENGYRCIHVFDWDNTEDLMYMLKPVSRVLYARNCDVWKIRKEVGDQFLNENHLQKSCRGQTLYLGLVCDNELVMLMTFGKSRYNKHCDIELLRLCSKRDIRVVGGASKLFHFATEEYGLSSIISYCDVSKFTGNVYEKIGMKYSHLTPPQLIWSRGTEKITSNLLRAKGYDKLFKTSYGKGTSNEMLMLQNGWLPVYDCGQKVYVFD